MYFNVLLQLKSWLFHKPKLTIWYLSSAGGKKETQPQRCWHWVWFVEDNKVFSGVTGDADKDDMFAVFLRSCSESGWSVLQLGWTLNIFWGDSQNLGKYDLWTQSSSMQMTL